MYSKYQFFKTVRFDTVVYSQSVTKEEADNSRQSTFATLKSQ